MHLWCKTVEKLLGQNCGQNTQMLTRCQFGEGGKLRWFFWDFQIWSAQCPLWLGIPFFIFLRIEIERLKRYATSKFHLSLSLIIGWGIPDDKWKKIKNQRSAVQIPIVTILTHESFLWPVMDTDILVRMRKPSM